MTDSNLTRFALVKEATRNTTPTNPVFQIMPATGITLTDNNQTVVSDEIRSDRMSSGEILVGRAGGEHRRQAIVPKWATSLGGSS